MAANLIAKDAPSQSTDQGAAAAIVVGELAQDASAECAGHGPLDRVGYDDIVGDFFEVANLALHRHLLGRLSARDLGGFGLRRGCGAA